jgi:phage baseplate assembly protein gpV
MMRWRRLIGVSLAVLVIVAGTTSCSGDVQNLHVRDRTLLIYPDSGSTADAAITGVLDVNAAGCIAVGKTVIVAPSGSVLMSDGSIVVHGTTYKLGSRVVIGGGGGKALDKSGCGSHLDYFYT